MALIDDMAEAIKEHNEAFINLNNNDDPTKVDIMNCVLMQTYLDLRDLLDRYENGER